MRFDKRTEAEVAIEKLNGKIYENIPEPLVVKFANSPSSVKSVMGIPLAPFIPTCRGFYQPYRSTSNSSYRYSPMNVAAAASQQQLAQPTTLAATAYCPTTLDPTASTLLHHQTLAALNGFATTSSLPTTPGWYSIPKLTGQHYPDDTTTTLTTNNISTNPNFYSYNNQINF